MVVKFAKQLLLPIELLNFKYEQDVDAERYLRLYSEPGTDISRYIVHKSAPVGAGVYGPYIDKNCWSIEIDRNESADNRFYFDGKYAFVLSARDDGHRIGLACAAFNLAWNRIDIVQIQGKRLNRKGFLLAPLEWEQMLVTLICDWACKHGISRARIQPSGKNRWRNTGKFSERYDRTAEKMGFVMNNSYLSDGYFEKQLD